MDEALRTELHQIDEILLSLEEELRRLIDARSRYA